MKKQFQSKSVPRGTRTIWRYLGALFILFTFAIGNVWAEDVTWEGPYGNFVTKKLSDNKTEITITKSISNSSKTISCIKSSNQSYLSINGNGKYLKFIAPTGYTITNIQMVWMSGAANQALPILFGEEISAIGTVETKDNAVTITNGGFKMTSVIATSGGNNCDSPDNIALPTGTKEVMIGRSGAYNNTDYATIGNVAATVKFRLAGSSGYFNTEVGTGSTPFIGRITLTVESECAATAPGNISKGALSAGVLTLNVADDPASGNKYYWQTSATGTTKKDSGDGKNEGKLFSVNAVGTYYVRSYYAADDCWSDAKSFTVTATDLVANYTVVYKDGTTELGNEVIAVGSHPEGIADPKKDCYTFAGWMNGTTPVADVTAISGTKDEVITLTASWTPNYASGAYSFVNTATVGTTPAKTVTTSKVSYEAFRIDNFYFSGMDITYEADASTALNDYKGWKINTKDATIKFLVENNCQVKVAIGRDNTAAVYYTALNGSAMNNVNQEKSTEVAYSVKAGTMFTISMTTGSTITLKRITISPLYNATYTDETGDADGSENNVAEVTLPTPTEATVGTSTFTGWTANKVVYDGETAKAVGAALEAGKTYKLTDNTEFTAQWALISDFDVKFFPGYEPNTQIGETQSISTGNYATAPADPSRDGYNFKGWSYDATEEHIVNVAEYAITAATNFTAIWKQVFAVTFDGAGSVNVESGSKVASPDSPSQAGKVFQGWYNGESKYDFSAAVTSNLALISKWADADPNHYVYAYNDDFHFDGVVYKTPEGKVDNGNGTSNKALTANPYTLFSGTGGITSVEMTDGIYDSKTGAIQAVTALMKVNNNATSKLTVTIKAGYTATLKIKSSGYSATRTINVSDAAPASGTTTGKAVDGGAMAVSTMGQLTFNLAAGSHDLTVTGGTLYIAELDIQATALPTFTVTYVPGEGTGDEVVDNDATMVADCPAGFTAPTGKAFNGWKDGDNNDVEVGATVTESMTLIAQWINQYAVTFDMQGHGSTIATQYIKHGAKATKPADPFVMGWDFGGWFTEATCENEFDFNTAIEAATPLFAKWTEFNGCTMLYPAKSGDAIAVGDPIVMQDGSFGGAMSALAIPDGGALNYTNSGLAFASKTGVKANVVLSNDIVAGTKIILTLVAGGDKTRGLFIYTKDGAKINDFTCWVDGVNPASNGLEDTFTYTVQAGDGLEGTNEFQLWRNNTVYLKSLKVSSCGDAIIYHDLTSEVNIAGKGTVTLGANTVREGHTTTATYSDIDPLYEFVSWSVSGTGASIEDVSANPATITMGTEDAVVTLNVQLIPVKFTVNYYDGTTPMGTEQVAVNENPTASEINTNKRHFTFQGWSETDGGSVVALNTITSDVAATINLYAVYAPVACPTEGTVFSMEFDNTKAPASTVKVAKNGGSIDLADYATLVGGNAVIENTETSDKDAISTDGKFKLTATKEVMKIELECAIATGDVIRIPDNNAKYVLSTSNAKTGTYQAQTSSQHEFEATAAWSGVDDLYILYDGSSLNFTKVYVLRPYTISFDLQGHGDAIDAQKLVEGKKVTAPTAPTADGWDFKGWYKEAACTNAWDFDNDVVDGTMSLFAKWTEHVTNDATLKSLKYGTTAITLVDGTYTYEVELAAAVAAVPALTAETNAALATKLITDATEFVAGQATSTVLVTAEDGATQLLYTVNFTKEAALPQVNVTEATVWNFATAVAGSTSMENLTDVVLANVPGITNDATFNSQALKGTFNKMPGNYFQGSKLNFTTEVPGKLTITFRGTNNNARHLQVCVGDGEAVVADWNYQGSGESAQQEKTVFVPAGKVTLKAFEGETAQNARIYNMIFDATPDYTRNVTNNIGTLCVDHNVPAGQYFGATFYQIASRNELYDYKIDFEEVLPNEELKAGEPYIFQSNTGKIELFYGATAVTEPEAVRGMHGWFDAAAPIDPTKYDMLDITEENKSDILYIAQNKLWNCEDLVDDDLKVVNNRAYIVMSEVPTYEQYTATPSAGAPRRRVTLGKDEAQVVTGFGELETSETPVKVLINGQIFIIRGEKMFDVTGKLVK